MHWRFLFLFNPRMPEGFFLSLPSFWFNPALSSATRIHTNAVMYFVKLFFALTHTLSHTHTHTHILSHSLTHTSLRGNHVSPSPYFFRLRLQHCKKHAFYREWESTQKMTFTSSLPWKRQKQKKWRKNNNFTSK